ncbi:MAG: hypothetical protein SHS37scaffold145_66 [Phage 71_18]|nr:MAG: hypothetical protein SHS37scaffold145_66 [Phage 71_18]
MTLETDVVMAGDRVYAALRMVRAIGAEPEAVSYGIGQPMVVTFCWHGHDYELTLGGGNLTAPTLGALGAELPDAVVELNADLAAWHSATMGEAADALARAVELPRLLARRDEVHAAMVMALVAFHRASAPQVGTLEQLVHRAYQLVGSGHVREPWVEDDVVEAIRQVLGR